MKKLYRSDQQKIVAGVCGGIAEYFEIDPVLIRLIWIVLIVFGGTGILAYLIAWIVIPTRQMKNEEPVVKEEPVVETPESKPQAQSQNMRLFWGIVLILIGLLIVANQFWWPLDFFRLVIKGIFKFFIPAILIVLGIFIILQGSERSKGK
ncbi:MAG: PspC domain-containing protein [Candidatus Marinimicrobia bacterium]|jgi:phage shock protein C|nr:PspC domain-containing protein [Candidatus Neomarinimicrobiota bacterium]